MTDADLVRQIRLGEDGRLEYKQIFFAGNRVTEPKRDKIADTLAALANGRGGIFVLGVHDKNPRDPGYSTGAAGYCRTLDTGHLHRSDHTSVGTTLIFAKSKYVETTEGSCRSSASTLPRSLFVHGSPGGYYRRLGDSTRRLHADSLARLFQERSQSRVIRFDESVVPWTTPEHLDGSLTERFLRDDVAATEDTLRKLRIVSEDPEDVARLTLAGVLLCTPDPQQWLPHAQIQAVSYAGERHDVNYQSDARDVNGPLDTQISEALPLCAPEHARSCHQGDRAGRMAAIQRACGVRGVGEMRWLIGTTRWPARACACICLRIGWSCMCPENWPIR